MTAAMIMQHVVMTMGPTFVFARMDLQEMDSTVQVTYSFAALYQFSLIMRGKCKFDYKHSMLPP